MQHSPPPEHAPETQEAQERQQETRPIRTAWALTDGKAGDLAQICGITDALGLEPEIRRVTPRAPWAWVMPTRLLPRWGLDPREDYQQPHSPIAPPFPDLVVASGRRTVAYVHRIRELSPQTYTVILKDPRTGPDTAHFIWVPEHDELRGENVFVTLTSPHRCSQARIEAARAEAPRLLPAQPAPRVAVMLGGNSVHHKWSPGVIRDFADRLRQMAQTGASFMVTPSRRTPPALLQAVKEALDGADAHIWDGTGENPYLAMLATADHLVVTADSVNMIGEALITGKPVYVFEPRGRHPKFRHFLDELHAAGAILPFDGRLQEARYAPIDATTTIASEIKRRYALWKEESRPADADGAGPGKANEA